MYFKKRAKTNTALAGDLQEQSLSIEILTCVELNDSLGSVRVRVGDGGQLGVLIYRIVNLKQTENYNLFEQISPGKLFN